MLFNSVSDLGLVSADKDGRMDRAEPLVDYLDVSDAQLVRAADRLAADGRYAIAAVSEDLVDVPSVRAVEPSATAGSA